MESIVKVWLLASSAVLLALSYGPPQSFSQYQRALGRPIRIVPAAQHSAEQSGSGGTRS